MWFHLSIKYRKIKARSCYPVFPIVPEAKAGWKQMVELAKKGGI